MVFSGAIWVPMAQRLLRQAARASAKVTRELRSQVAAVARHVEPVPVRSGTSSFSPYHQYHQPLHPVAFRRQAKRASAKWFSTNSHSFFSGGLNATVRRFLSGSAGRSASPRFVDRVAYLKTSVGTNAIWKSTGRAPFSSTLRPNLTGGALPRTAGGYALGGGAGRAGGARYFSHTPAAPAQVVQNVSQAMRAFWLSGQRARFDGTDSRGRPCYKAISALEEDLARKMAIPAMPKMAPGAFVDFSLNPTITALTPLAAAFPYATSGVKKAAVAAAGATTLGTEGFLDVLSVDFSRALKEYTAVMNDLKKLAGLGDLPVLLEKSAVLRVRFPGVDAETVDRLCEDLGVTRGIIGQDPGFDMTMGTTAAMKFPFAPDSEPATLTSPGGSMRSHLSALSSPSPSPSLMESTDDEDVYEAYFADFPDEDVNPWLSLPPSSEEADANGPDGITSSHAANSGEHVSEEFEGLEGIYRFLEECDRMKGRY